MDRAPTLDTWAPNHPAWIAIDDDDWNAATLANVLCGKKPDDRIVLLWHPAVHDEAKCKRLLTACARFCFVRVVQV